MASLVWSHKSLLANKLSILQKRSAADADDTS